VGSGAVIWRRLSEVNWSVETLDQPGPLLNRGDKVNLFFNQWVKALLKASRERREHPGSFTYLVFAMEEVKGGVSMHVTWLEVKRRRQL